MKEELIKPESGISVSISGTSMLGKNTKSGILSNMHIHKEYEFIQLNKGEIRCVTLEGEYAVKSGDILFLNSYIPHSTFSTTDGEQDTVIQFKLSAKPDPALHYAMSFKNISDTTAFVFKSNNPQTAELCSYINKITDEYINKRPFRNDYINATIYMIIAFLRRNNILSAPADSNIIKISKLKPVLEYINNNYADNISTSTLAEIMSFNETYFCRLFKNAIGTNPINYLNFVRICKAEQLLNEDISLSEIVEKTGFSSLSYFNRIFKKFNYYSPIEYRKFIKNNEIILSSSNSNDH